MDVFASRRVVECGSAFLAGLAGSGLMMHCYGRWAAAPRRGATEDFSVNSRQPAAGKFGASDDLPDAETHSLQRAKARSAQAIGGGMTGTERELQPEPELQSQSQQQTQQQHVRQRRQQQQQPRRRNSTRQGPAAQRADALDRFYAANVPDDWKRTGLSQAELERHAKRWLVPVAVGILNLTSDWNVGAIMRTAALFKFCRFVILGRNKYDTRGAVGASRYIEVQKQPAMQGDQVQVDVLREYLRRECFTPVFIAGRGGGRGDTRGAGSMCHEQAGAKQGGGVLLGRMSWSEAYALLPDGQQFLLMLGNEGVGIPPEVLALRFEFPGSFILSVEQFGMMRSMNVAVAAGIVLHHCASWHVGRLSTAGSLLPA